MLKNDNLNYPVKNNIWKITTLFLLFFISSLFILPKTIWAADGTWSINSQGLLINNYKDVERDYNFWDTTPGTYSVGSYKDIQLADDSLHIKKPIYPVLIISKDKKTILSAGFEVLIDPTPNPQLTKTKCKEITQQGESDLNRVLCLNLDTITQVQPQLKDEVNKIRADLSLLQYYQYVMSLKNVPIGDSSSGSNSPAQTTPATETANSNTASSNSSTGLEGLDTTAPQITGVHLVDWIRNQGTFYTIWKNMVGIMDILVVIGFIVFALANVFHIKYDEYQAKKAIPGLIIGVILANLSYSICLFFIGLVQYLTNLFAGDPTAFWSNFSNLYAWVWTLATTVSLVGLGLSNVTGPGILIAGIVIFLIPVLIMLAMGFIIWIRAFGIIALIGFAPLAFFLQTFPIQIPFLSDLAKKWWDYFFKLLFVGPIMFFLFWLAFMINGYAANNSSPSANQPSSTITDSIAAAKDWCTRQKASMSDADWRKGRCLGNLADPNSQIAVQVITGNTKTDKDNKCTNSTKYITIDLDCSKTIKVGF